MRPYILLANRTMKLLVRRTLYYVIVTLEHLALLACHIASLVVWPAAIGLGAGIKQLEETTSKYQLPRGQ